ncbi:probable basic-leucine zipper transcription factor Q [Haliotis rubra]|uniref:probable basic-leucine zipper transcription factor Q n=1 Tax=Haliotis rubra TaxID=36100 RepID=UPI001EE5DF42|nr:probable basic-leucine zipper transcription factor Q [Haliotis rubra]
MTSVNVLVGCLAVMGSVQSNEENGDPPQVIQHPQQRDGDPPQHVRPPQRDRAPPQEIAPPQQDPNQFYGPDPGDVQSEQQQQFIQHASQQQNRRSNSQRDVLNVYTQPLQVRTRSTEQQVIDIMLTELQQKPFQKEENSITVPQFIYLQCMILAGLFTSVLIKTFSKKQQSNQGATKTKETSEHHTDQQQSQGKQHSQQIQDFTHQEEQEARQPRSIVFAVPSRQSEDILNTQSIQAREAAIPPSAVPCQQNVDILKTQCIQARVAKLLADLRKQLQAVATESVPAACKQRLFNTCAGGLRAAALC